MKPVLMLCLLCIFPASLRSQSERSLIRDGNASYGDTKFSDAEVDYRKALEKNRESQTGVFNLGDALYKQGRYAEAAQQYALTASKASDRDVRAKAYHNLGNSLLKVQKYPESVSAFKEALKANPEDLDTKYNYEFARAMLRQQQQQQQQKNDKQKNDKQKNDKQDKQQQQQDQQNKDQRKGQDQAQNQQNGEKKADQDNTRTAQARKQQISKEDAERILQALNNEEKDVQKKLHKKVPAHVKIDKDW
ncbi:MAG TPA: tetratricopeptide repeat protein [Bacteroidota bacterium]|nr:tetratricopeptide repeat protein [Bacteroidota bacterium]